MKEAYNIGDTIVSSFTEDHNISGVIVAFSVNGNYLIEVLDSCKEKGWSADRHPNIRRFTNFTAFIPTKTYYFINKASAKKLINSKLTFLEQCRLSRGVLI